MRVSILVLLAAVLLTGCRKDIQGAATLNVQTTFPEGVPVMLVSTERIGTYVQKVKTDISGTLRYVGIEPGHYKLIYQFNAPTLVPSEVPYTYGESGTFEVTKGANVYDWTIGVNSTFARRPK